MKTTLGKVTIDITMCNNAQCEKQDKCIRYAKDAPQDLNTENKKRCKYYGSREMYESFCKIFSDGE